MANKRIEYTVGFKGDASQLKTTLSDVTTQLNKLGTNSSNRLTASLREASNAALDLSNKLAQATNQSTGKLDLMNFNKSLQSSGQTLQKYAQQMARLGPEGKQAFQQVANAIMQAEMPIRRSSKMLDGMWTTMKNTAKWQLSSSAIHAFMGALQSAYGYAQDLNESLNNIRIVTGKSADEMKEFAKEANKAAQTLSTTTTKYTDASLIYYQQGLDGKDVQDRTDTTIKLMNVTGQSAEETSNQLTAIWNNFYDGSKSLEYYADVITALGAATASSTEEISTGLEKFAAVAETVGLSYEYATSALATVTAETRQSAEVVGTAFKTLFARIQDLELGDTLDDGTTLGKYSEALSIVGINIKEQNGELKDMDDILDEMGEKWQTLNDDQKVSLAQTVAGVRQYTQLIALMDNWDVFQENLGTATGSTGELNKQAEIYAESWEAARDRTKAAAENVYDSIINEDFFIDMNKVFEPLLNGFASIIDAAGGMGGVLNIAFYALTSLFGNKIVAGLRTLKDNFLILTGVAQKNALALKETAAAQLTESNDSKSNVQKAQTALYKEELNIQKSILNLGRQYTKEEIQQIANEKQILNSKQQQLIADQQRIDDLNTEIQAFKQYTFAEDIAANGISKREAGANMKSALGETSHLSQSFKDGLINAKSLDQRLEMIGNRLQTLGKRSSGATQLRQQLMEAKMAGRGSSEEIIKLAKSLNLLSSKKDYTVDEAIEALGRSAIKSNNQIRELSNVLKAMGVDPANVDQFNSAIVKLGISADMSEEQIEELRKQMVDFDNKLKSGSFHTKDFATGLVNVSSKLSQVSMAIQAVQTLGNIFTNEDMTLTERITQGLMALSMLLPVVSASVNALTASMGALDAVEGKQIIKSNGSVLARIAEKFATDAATKSTISYATAQMVALGVIGAIVIAVVGLVAIIDALTLSQKEATKNIEKANEAYEEEKKKLEELENQLKTVQDRMKELQEQDSLTFVEQEELKRLETENKLLERQIALQREIETQKRKEAAQTRKENRSTAYKDVLGDNFLVGEYLNYEESAKRASLLQKVTSIEAQKNNYVLQHGYEEYEKILKEAKDSLEQYDKILYDKYGKEFASKYSEQYTAINEGFLQDYKDYQDGIINFNDFEKSAADLYKANSKIYTEGEMIDLFIRPVLDESAVDEVDDQLFKIANSAKNETEAIEQMQKALTQEMKDEIVASGMSVEQFLSHVVTIAQQARDKINELEPDKWKQADKDKLANLTSEDLEIVAQLNIENIKSADELWAAIERYKNTKIDLDVNVSGTEQLMELYDKIEAKNNPLETALKAYRENGKLSAKEAQELISENSEYAKYLIKTADGYALSTEALEDYNAQISQQTALLDEAIEAEQNKYNIDHSTFQDPIELLKESSEGGAKAALGVTDYTNALKELKNNSDYTYDEILDATSNFIGKNAYLFEKLDYSNPEKLDSAEKAYTATFDVINQVLANNEKAYKSGKITASEYYKNAKTSMEQLQKLATKTGVVEIDEKTGEYKLNSKAAKELDENGKQRAQALVDAANNYLKNEGKIKLGEALVKLFDDNAEFLQDHQEYGRIKFTTEAEFKSAKATKDMQAYAEQAAKAIRGLKGVNDQVYNDILKQLNITDDAAIESEANISKALLSDQSTFENVTNTLLAESGTAVSSLGSAIGLTISSLGDLISNFEYTITFTPVITDSHENVIAAFAKILAGKSAKLPELEMTISGKAGGDTEKEIANFAATTAALGDYYEGMTLARDGAQNAGINAYGKSDGKDPKALNPDNINLEDDDKDSGKDKEIKELVEFEDIYHEINKEIDAQDRKLSNLETQIDRTFGSKKLKLLQDYRNELAKLVTKYESYNSKLDKEKDTKANELKAAGLGAIVDKETGVIENYEELMDKIHDDYNDFLENYNSMSKAQQDLNKEALEEAEKKYNKQKELLEEYEELIDKEIENNEKIAELRREEQDRRLEEITERLEIILTIKGMKDAAREFSIAIEESFGDALTHAAKVAELRKDGVLEDMKLVPKLEQQLNDLQGLLAEGNPYMDTAEVIAQIEDLQGKIIETGESMLEWIEYIEELLPGVIDAARERFNKFIDQLEHNKTISSTIKELMILQGVTYKTLEGFNSLQKANQNQLNASLAQATLNKQWMERAAEELKIAEEALAGKVETDAGYDTLRNNRDALLAEFNEAQEAMYSSAKEAMEMAKEMYTLAIEQAMYDFEQAITGGLGADLLQMKYDNLISQEEKYLDLVNQEYEIAKWNRQLDKAVDEASSLAAANRLKELQKEIELRKQNGKLSQYDLDILKAKYDLTLAQITLEEAQNAKSSMRLVRNTRGTFDYVYTADQSAIDEAQQNLEDANNEYYNTAKDRFKEATGEIVRIRTEMQDQIEELFKDETLSAEERNAKLKEITEAAYKEYDYWFDQMHISAKDMSDASALEFADLGSEFNDIMGLMSLNADQFRTETEKALGEANAAFKEYQGVVDSVAQATGTDLGSLNKALEDIAGNTDTVKEAAKLATDAMWDQIHIVQQLTIEYAKLAEKVMEAIRKLEELAYKAADSAAKENGDISKADLTKVALALMTEKGYTAAEARAAIEVMRQEKIDKLGMDESEYGSIGDEYWDMLTDVAIQMKGGNKTDKSIADYVASGMLDKSYANLSDDDKALLGQFSNLTDPNAKINSDKAAYDYVKSINPSITEAEFKAAYSQGLKEFLDWLQKKERELGYEEDNLTTEKILKAYGITGFATGGYTGDFDNAKLAFLHEKELVLNQADTKNILSAVDLAREFLSGDLITRAFNAVKTASLNLLNDMLRVDASYGRDDGTLKQEVSINASFPNVSSAREIEEALNNLINDAAQFASINNN